jgi:hypothetical protein
MMMFKHFFVAGAKSGRLIPIGIVRVAAVGNLGEATRCCFLNA